ncbi:MAG: TrmH family RNA methyltransferase [Spirochaetaceae bacterium]|nr:MAG: TrmH family RNA methyltransferase [Spirochaetaceae bacterium]
MIDGQTGEDTRARIAWLSQFVTGRRLQTMYGVLANRTRFVTVVLEDIFQPHNASAVLRSCDCFGVQDVHIIENRNSYRINPDVELGTAQWLTLKRYSEREDNTPAALRALRTGGYRLVAATPHGDTVSIDDFDVTAQPTALMLGTELQGLSADALAAADVRLRIPMYGFVESFNISVSAAIILSRLCSQLRRSDVAWRLSTEQQHDLLLAWLRRSVRKSDLLERQYERSPRSAATLQTSDGNRRP